MPINLRHPQIKARRPTPCRSTRPWSWYNQWTGDARCRWWRTDSWPRSTESTAPLHILRVPRTPGPVEILVDPSHINVYMHILSILHIIQTYEYIWYVCIPCDNQTWQWPSPYKWCSLEQSSIFFHCNVWLPGGVVATCPMIFPLKHSPFWNDFPFKNKSSMARSPTQVNMQVAPNLAIPVLIYKKNQDVRKSEASCISQIP